MLHFFTTVTQEQDEKTGDIELNDILKSISIPEYDVYVDEDCVNCPFDVTNFLPTWLVDDHHAGNTLFVKFVQHYFDWLYCTDKSNIYMNKVFDLSDIENVNEKTVMSVLKSHIPGLYSALSKSSTVYIGDPIFEEGTGSNIPNHPMKVFGWDVNQVEYPGAGYFFPVYLSPPPGDYHEHTIYHRYRQRTSGEYSDCFGGTTTMFKSGCSDDPNGIPSCPDGYSCIGEGSVPGQDPEEQEAQTYDDCETPNQTTNICESDEPIKFYMPSDESNHAVILNPDMNGDGVVDGADVGLFLAEWGSDREAADFNGDGVVDGSDFGLLLADWGEAGGLLPEYTIDTPISNETDVSDWNYAISIDKIKTLLKNIKPLVYQRKTTVTAVEYVFKTLFGNEVDVSIPNYEDHQPFLIELTLSGSPRNNDDFLQFCKDVYEQLFHPVGFNYTFHIQSNLNRLPSQEQDNQTEERRASSNYNPRLSSDRCTSGFTLEAFEFPLLGNYYVYHSDDIATIAPVSGCYPGGTANPRGITANTSNMATFTHPNWYHGTSGGTSFGNINISGMMMLPFEDNPNIGITSCANL